MAQSLQAAANPNAEAPDVVIASLPAARRATVQATVKQVSDFQRGITQRGGKALLAISEQDWQALLSGG